MTKYYVDTVGWHYLVIVLDWFTKKIVGWDLSLRSKKKLFGPEIMTSLMKLIKQLKILLCLIIATTLTRLLKYQPIHFEKQYNYSKVA